MVTLVLTNLLEAPVSIVVEGTTTESTDVDEVVDTSTDIIHDRKPKYVREETNVPITKRNGTKPSKNRPVSDGHILSHEAYLHSKVTYVTYCQQVAFVLILKIFCVFRKPMAKRNLQLDPVYQRRYMIFRVLLKRRIQVQI